MPKALVIPCNRNNPIEVKELTGYHELVKAVGGYLEALLVADNAHAYVNEEGKFQNLPVNGRADKVVRALIDKASGGRANLSAADYIVGDIIILGSLNRGGKNDGEEHDVPEDLVKLVQGMFK